MNIKKLCMSTAVASWCGLGFYRGYTSYDNKSTNKLNAIGYGFCGLFIYINPFSLPLILEMEYQKAKSSH